MKAVCVYLALLCIFAGAVQVYGGTEYLLLDKAKLGQEPWRIVTSLFVHGSPGHLLANLFSLLLFGLMLEGVTTPRKVLVLFLLAGVLSNIFSPYERSLGASGAIMGIIGAFTILRPKTVIWMNGMPVPMILAGIGYVIQDSLGLFVPDGVGHAVHLLGMGLGVSAGVFWRYQQSSQATNEHPS